MKEKYIAGTVIVFLALLAAVFFLGSRGDALPNVEPLRATTTVASLSDQVKSATYLIDGEAITLTSGVSVLPTAPESASIETTKIFGEPVIGDINGDGKNDAAILLVQNTGGSGMFYYLAVAYATSTSVLGSNALFLGDRIAPQTVEIRNGMIIANYATRKADESMTTQPSFGMTLYAKHAPTLMLTTVRMENIGRVAL